MKKLGLKVITVNELNPGNLEDEVNRYLNILLDKVVDIKFSTCVTPTGATKYSAMIIFKEW